MNGANFSQQNINNAIADDFALGAADTIQSVSFPGVPWISGVVPADDNFQITIYGDLAGAPDVGNVIGTSVLTLFSRTDTGFDHNNVAGADIYRYAMNLAAPINVALGAHWVSIVSTTTAVATSFAWQRTDAVGNAVLSTDGGLTFSGTWGENVFSLSNTPASPRAVDRPARCRWTRRADVAHT